MAPASYQAATSDSKACTRSGVLCATIAPVTFCCSSLPVYGVKSRLMVTFGATCLYWLTSSWSVPPWVPGSVPFMPCQKVMLTGAALAAAAGLAVAAGALVVAAAGLAAVVGALEVVAAAGTEVGALPAAAAPAPAADAGALPAVTAGGDVGALGAAVEHATITTEIRSGITLSRRI